MQRFTVTGDPFAGSDAPDTGGNGSIMRLGPVALVALSDAALAERLAIDQSRTTHAAPACLNACRFMVPG